MGEHRDGDPPLQIIYVLLRKPLDFPGDLRVLVDLIVQSPLVGPNYSLLDVLLGEGCLHLLDLQVLGIP